MNVVPFKGWISIHHPKRDLEQLFAHVFVMFERDICCKACVSVQLGILAVSIAVSGSLNRWDR